ncbi:hypothetical protein L596_006419 [Steinernema carpocapsae]|uniref:Uncharacterized protein n=1 Tax=Steinernema carpocapsae TaxID=34508 RepID=A0A4V6YT00_STECR|nr:hypothetical protein L596_006419 [Steinernema carpocapsae]
MNETNLEYERASCNRDATLNSLGTLAYRSSLIVDSRRKTRRILTADLGTTKARADICGQREENTVCAAYPINLAPVHGRWS